MRELTSEEIEQVGGGVGLFGAGIGAAIGGGSAVFNGASLGQVVGATILGGVSGFFGGIATSRYASGAASFLFGAYSVESGIMSSAAGS